MAAGGHTGGAAAGKSYLYRPCRTQHLMAFKELYGQERDFLYRLYILLIPVQKSAKIPVYPIIVILVAKGFERDLFKLFL